MANAYVMRTNMSVAIVAMVNHTFVEAGHKEIFDDECPNYINTTSSVSVADSSYRPKRNFVIMNSHTEWLFIWETNSFGNKIF